MKLIELLNKIANGEIKEGTKIKIDGLFYVIDDIPMHKDEFKDIFCFDFNVLNNEVEIIEEKQQGRWKPKEGERYWFIDSCEGIYRSTWSSAKFNNWRYITKNIFKTEKEAAEYLEYKKALLEAEKPFEYGIDNYYIYHERDTEDTVLRITNFEQVQGTVYLGNDFGIAEAFLDKWYKQILKYEFGIDE